jgi:hypothetical protein
MMPIVLAVLDPLAMLATEQRFALRQFLALSERPMAVLHAVLF